jgi:hypothetical protein
LKGNILEATGKYFTGIEKKLRLCETPAPLTQLLLRREQFQGRILEPCVGRGAIADELIKEGYSDLELADIHDWGYSSETIIQNFLERKARTDNIITNPPYHLTMPIIKHALKLARLKVAMLIPLDREINCIAYCERIDWGLKALYICKQNIKWLNMIRSQRGITWFVFEKGYEGPTHRELITFNRRKN